LFSFLFTLSPSLSTLQCLHNSETDQSYHTKLQSIERSKKSKSKDPSLAFTYNLRKSYTSPLLDSPYETPEGSEVLMPSLSPGYQFLKVYNQGSSEFQSLGLEEDFKQLDLLKLAAHVNSTAQVDPKRTNKQDNIGFSAGENVMRFEKELREHSGCSMNQKNNGTDDFRWLFVLLSKMARKLGLSWATEDNIQCELFRERNKLYAKVIDPNNCFEGVTIALLELSPNPARVSDHMDVHNDGVYTDTMVCNGIVWLDGKLYRVSLIAYLRKACGDSIVRRRACQETVQHSLKYLATTCSSRIPVSSPATAATFYEGVGEMGLGLSVTDPLDLTDCGMKVNSAALLSLPHLDKPFGFLSPVSHQLREIYQKNPQLTKDDLCALCFPAGHLNGVFSYTAALQNLLARRVLLPMGRLGYLGTVVDELINVSGSYSGGGFRRAQVSWSDTTMDVDRTLIELSFVVNLCEKSCESPPTGVSYEAFCRSQMYEVTKQLCAKYS
jgi:hypothetical protein